MMPRPPTSTLFPYTTLFRSTRISPMPHGSRWRPPRTRHEFRTGFPSAGRCGRGGLRSEEHTSELQSQSNLVCRLLLEKKKKEITYLSSLSTHHQHSLT